MPISNNLPNFEQVQHSCVPQRISNTSSAIPTNTFWSNFIISDGTGAVFISPYKIWFNGSKLNINVCQNVVEDKSITTNSDINFSILPGLNRTFQIVEWDDLSVHVKSGNVLYYFVKGSPFITFEVNNDFIQFGTQTGILSVKKIDVNKYSVSLLNGQTWLIYHNGGLILDAQLKSSIPYNGIARLISIPTEFENTISMLNIDSHVNIYPVGGTVSYTVGEHVGRLNFNWQTKKMLTIYPTSDLLMYIMPHHTKSMSVPNLPNLPTYFTTKGKMVPYIGTLWTQIFELSTVKFEPTNKINLDPNLNTNLNTNCIQILKNSIESDRKTRPYALDPYFFGKQISRLARLVQISDELGMVDVRNSILTDIISDIKPWLEGTNSNKLLFDVTWGGIISTEGHKNSEGDFGQGWYNDHHYQYGYFIYAIAIICKFDKNFYPSYENEILSIVFDIANPFKTSPEFNPRFPVARHKDWYEGHSWASGLKFDHRGKNQESTSEAVNAYYSVYLLGLVIDNTEIADMGKILLNTEIISAQTYWHIYDSTVYPEPFSKNTTVGILFSTEVLYNTWFGDLDEYVHCVQLLPFTPISEFLLDKEWIKLQEPIFDKILEKDVGDGWKGYIMMAKAIINPNQALKWITEFEGEYDDGCSKSNILHWILTRPNISDQLLLPAEITKIDLPTILSNLPTTVQGTNLSNQLIPTPIPNPPIPASVSPSLASNLTAPLPTIKQILPNITTQIITEWPSEKDTFYNIQVTIVNDTKSSIKDVIFDLPENIISQWSCLLTSTHLSLPTYITSYPISVGGMFLFGIIVKNSIPDFVPIKVIYNK